MALGVPAPVMARKLGIDLPIYPLKGYNITLPLSGPDRLAPHMSVNDTARKVVFARVGSRLRVAGMVELVGHDNRISHARIEELVNATRALSPGCSDMTDLHPWTGMRPATPTALPIVGRHPRGPPNLLLNVGHGALGFTLAFGTAERVTALLC